MAITARRWLGPGLTFVLASLFFARLHAVSGGPTDRDAFYHARVASYLPERGLSRSFPWTVASTWAKRYCDKEFLYHVYLAPFALGEEPLAGVLWASVFLSAAVFAGFHWLIREEGCPAAWAFTLLLAGAAGPFLLRISYVRPHVAAVLLVLAAWRALMRGDVRWLSVLGFALSWTYSFPPILPALALAYAVGAAAVGEGLAWRPVAAAAGGVLAGLVFHPFSPNSLDSIATYFQVVRIAALERSLAAVEVGRELAPYSTRGFLQLHAPMAGLVAGLTALGWGTTKRLGGAAAGTLAAAWAALVGTMVFPRFVEYAAPLSVLAAALAARDLAKQGGREALERAAKANPTAFGLGAGGLLAVVLGAALTSAAYAYSLGTGNDGPRFRGAAGWFSENLKPGETVVNLWWDDLPELFYDAPAQRYLVGLDPTYMLRWDPEKALRLEAMRGGRIPLDPDWLADAFQARVMVLRAPYTRYYPQLDWKLWQPVYADATAAVYALRGPQGPSPRAYPPAPRYGPERPEAK
ncbi:hypothetical protein EPO15_08830 [bacterium]|nr:MAG: hypothetical protein EPO15_08830 [bacterium]